MTNVLKKINNFHLVKLGLQYNYRTCTTKSTPAESSKKKCQEKVLKSYGQPTFITHPHLLKEGEVVPGITAEEFKLRRKNLIEKIYQFGKKYERDVKHLVVIPSATKLYMTQKIPYIFRQNSDFLYLSGCLESDSALVLYGENEDNFTSTLFLRKKDSHSELWDGPTTQEEDAPHLFGVDSALSMTELGKYLLSTANEHSLCIIWYDFLNPVKTELNKLMQDLLGGCWNKIWESPTAILQNQRLLKSSAEIALMKTSCKIASDAISATISTSYEGISEHQIFAKVDYECRMRGAEHLAYPPVVAGGSRANTIHYIRNNQIVKSGEMVLMDAGCEYHGYCSDITRTWPISRKFTDPQQVLYEIVLSIQLDLINMCSTFPSLDFLFHTMCSMLGRRLKEAGVLPKSKFTSEEELSRVAYSFCPHHVGHYLGMDVHDTPLVSRSINLEPGMVITIEPGIYINRSNKTAPIEFHGLGVRIEDDVLITENGAEVLTASCPKYVEDIEKLYS